MHIPAFQAALFAVFVIPIWLYTFYVDMKLKKISNLTVWALFAVFVVIGFLTMPIGEYLWRFAHYGVVFAVGFAFWMLRQVGAGDVKFAAVAALFIHQGDLRLMMFIAIAAMLAATVTTLLVTFSPLKKLAPNWATWKMRDPNNPDSVGGGKQFTLPMGTGLGLMLCAYLVLGVFNGQ